MMKDSQRKAMFAHLNGAINFSCVSSKNKFSDFFVRPTNTDLINNHKLGIGYQGPEMSARPKKKMGSFSSAGNYKWMKGCDTKTTKGAGKAMKSTGKLLGNIISKGKTKKAFKDY